MNENDPIVVDGAPRELVLLTRDDRTSDTAQTVAAVEQFLGPDNAFSILTLGTVNSWVSYDRINAACVPQPFVMSQHPAGGDPVQHPWTTGMELSYSTEARLWGEWIRHNLAEHLPVRVAGLVADHYFGRTWEHAFGEWAAENTDVVSEFNSFRHEADGRNLQGRVVAAARSEPDVLIAMTATDGCAQTITEVEAAGLRDTLAAAFVTTGCEVADRDMAPAGTAAEGWWIANGGAKRIDDPQYADEPLMSLLRARMPAGTSALSRDLFGTGFRHGFAYVEALRVAAALPGGLTRTNFILAARTLDIRHPLYLDGISVRMNGNSDAYLIEGSQFSQYDAGKRDWVQVGGVIDINGETPNCEWNYRAWLSGRRPRGWEAGISNLTPGKFATVSGTMGEPRAYAAAFRATSTGAESGTWCEGLPVNIRTGYWALASGTWCLFYDYSTASWQQSDAGGQGFVQVNDEPVRLRVGQEIRLDDGDAVVVATYSGERVYKCRLRWTRD